MIILPLAFSVSMVLLAGYNGPDQNQLQQQQSASSANEKAGRMAAADRDAYLKTARRDLDQLSEQIEALKLKANKSGTAMRASLERKIHGFEDDHKNLEESWQQAKDAGESSWQEFKLSFTAGMEKLKKAVHNATR